MNGKTKKRLGKTRRSVTTEVEEYLPKGSKHLQRRTTVTHRLGRPGNRVDSSAERKRSGRAPWRGD